MKDTLIINGKPSEFKKFDSGKPKMGLLDSDFLTDLAKVMTYGADKYSDKDTGQSGANNWRLGTTHSRYFDAMQRHLWAYQAGEDLDLESGLPHLAHAGCCLMMLMGIIRSHPELDDRR